MRTFRDGGFPHFLMKAQVRFCAAQKIDPDLPFAVPGDVKMRRKVVVGIEPEPEPVGGDAIYLAQPAPLCP